MFFGWTVSFLSSLLKLLTLMGWRHDPINIVFLSREIDFCRSMKFRIHSFLDNKILCSYRCMWKNVPGVTDCNDPLWICFIECQNFNVKGRNFESMDNCSQIFIKYYIKYFSKFPKISKSYILWKILSKSCFVLFFFHLTLSSFISNW